MRRLKLLAVLASLLALLAIAATGVGRTSAAFTSTTSNDSNTFASKRIFPAVRSESAWTISDSTGTTTDKSDAFAASGGNTYTTGSWSSSFSTSRWLSFAFDNPRAAGISTSNVAFNFDFAPTTSTDTACFYFDVVQTSTSTVLATHGSSASPVACATGASFTTTSTSLPEITSTDLANDLTIKVYAKESGNSTIKVDRAMITGDTPYTTGFPLYEQSYRDQANGFASVSTPWSLIAQDGTGYVAANNWSTTFGTKSISFTFPASHVPTGATVTSVTLTSRYKSNTSGDIACAYYETYSGATLLGSHGSSSSAYSCTTAGGTTTDTITLSEVTTPAQVNGLIVKMYCKENSNKKTNHDLLQLDVNYYLD